MSVYGPGDNGLAMMQLSQQDMIQKKLDMDSFNERMNGKPNKEAKLREACEGFESIFIQKMWDQMRKNVQKSGYLHSRDEHMYQSMYDAEFSKKMTEAGGIGLADMLYEQLSQRLGESSRTTSPRNNPRLPIVPATSAIGGLAGGPAPLDNAREGIALDKRSIRPLYEDAPVAGSAVAPAAVAAPEADLAEFDENLLEDGQSAAAEATAAPALAPYSEDADFEALSHELLARELGGEAAPAAPTGNPPLSSAVNRPVSPPMSPEEEAMISAALRQSMAEAGRIGAAQAPAPQGRFGTAFADDMANPADSAARSDINQASRS